eukprot:CAMPEP_0196143800 /NCGR_PEP_ID=MMETSP0910-20130528/13719_1 /TAXON_ID=49265 /ORGANISM="Thalassiosira rotula, Strain GSO102" /LENGTH=763 /DNA_ID=CAMNT_0041405287 /DNA_START=117 /DNA_END=2408 /DNA_ORIENTATION=-
MGQCSSSPPPQQPPNGGGDANNNNVAKTKAQAYRDPKDLLDLSIKPPVLLSDPKVNPNKQPQSTDTRTEASGIGNTHVKLILKMTDDKPLDATDISDLKAAKNEIKFIRKFAQEFLELKDEEVEEDARNAEKFVRGALYDKQDFMSFRKVSYEKTEEIRSLIFDAIKPNVLFENETKAEMLQIIDVFKPQEFKKGDVVIQQGDEGSEFYVVESGNLSIQIAVKGKDGEESQVHGGNYGRGGAFGEIALIFDTPRAATIKATSDCRLWSIERKTYRSVIQQLRYEEHKEKNAFIKKCMVNGKKFTEVFDGGQIEDLTIATKVDSYKKGEVILREGQMGDTFYIVKSGKIETYATGRNKMLGEKEVFGTTSLLKGVVSPLTYKAVSDDVEVYYLTRLDFESIMGPLQDALDGNTVARSVARMESRKTMKTSMSTDQKYELELDDLDFFNVLGKGAFGMVTLVQSKATKKVFALKAQSKHYIEKKGQKEHVLNEYRIMREMEHPNILGMHCAMQDKEHLYFLLDLLPGGELMTYLVKKARNGKGFAEDVTRFYAASVVLAYEALHSLMIAYRDLKPENIVLTKKGYGVVVDFGLAKEIDEGQTYTFCGTPDYLAPEIIRASGHDWAVDYWGLGVFLFEMTNGTAPFYATNQARRTRKIMKGFEFVRVPAHFSGGLTDLISSLLISDPSKRLGRTLNGVKGIINHRWFAGFDWQGFEEQTIEAPIKVDIPGDIKTLGKHKHSDNVFQESSYAPESEWWPDLKNLDQW